MTESRLHTVVIAGGSGTRFWPMSRAKKPKQLLALSGDNTLLKNTFLRVESLVPPDRWWMVVGAGYADACAQEASDMSTSHVLAEPFGRNTAPAIALAAIQLRQSGSDDPMVVLPADHHVEDVEAFCASLRIAEEAARGDAIVTLGISPTRPETGYGYIEAGEPSGPDGALAVKRFREKPDKATAEGFLAAGGYFWNAGIFIMKPSTYLAEVERQIPDLHAAMAPLGDAIGTDGYEATLKACFDASPNVSIDYGVMEGAKSVLVVPTDCGWSDVGSWDALGSVVAADDKGNVKKGDVIDVDSEGCVMFAHEGTVATVGLKDIVVVHTADATLVLPKERAQDVRAIMAQLKDGKREDRL